MSTAKTFNFDEQYDYGRLFEDALESYLQKERSWTVTEGVLAGLRHYDMVLHDGARERVIETKYEAAWPLPLSRNIFVELFDVVGVSVEQAKVLYDHRRCRDLAWDSATTGVSEDHCVKYTGFGRALRAGVTDWWHGFPREVKGDDTAAAYELALTQDSLEALHDLIEVIAARRERSFNFVRQRGNKRVTVGLAIDKTRFLRCFPHQLVEVPLGI